MPWQLHKLQFRRVENIPLFLRGYVGFLNVFRTFFQQTWLPADDRKRKAWLSWIARHTWWQTWKRLSQLVRVQWRVCTLPRKSSTYSHGAADRNSNNYQLNILVGQEQRFSDLTTWLITAHNTDNYIYTTALGQSGDKNRTWWRQNEFQMAQLQTFSGGQPPDH